MMIIGPDFDLFQSGVVIVSGKNSGRRTDLIHQGDREEGVGPGTCGEVDSIEIRQWIENRCNFVAMDLAILNDFLIREAIGNLRCALIGTKEGTSKNISRCR